MKRAVSATVLALGCWIVACVGDDPSPTSAGPQPDPNVPVGQFRGACTADGKCIEGLVCTQGVCLEGVDGGGGGPGIDSGPPPPVDASGTDAGPVTCKYQDLYSGPISCSNVTCTTTHCCIGSSGPVACEPDCPLATSPKAMRCDTSAMCMSGSAPICCVRIKAPLDTTKCTTPVTYTDFAEAVCVASCADVNDYLACRQDSDCAASGKTCRAVELSNGSDKFTFGICH